MQLAGNERGNFSEKFQIDQLLPKNYKSICELIRGDENLFLYRIIQNQVAIANEYQKG